MVISFIAPALFWDRFVGFMYPWNHPRKLMTRALLGFAALVAALSLPSLLIDLLGDLYATAWWIPIYTDGDNFGSWEGGIHAAAQHEAAARAVGASGGALATPGHQPMKAAQAMGAAVGSAALAVSKLKVAAATGASTGAALAAMAPTPAAKTPSPAPSASAAHLQHGPHSHPHDQGNASRTGAPRAPAAGTNAAAPAAGTKAAAPAGGTKAAAPAAGTKARAAPGRRLRSNNSARGVHYR